MYCVFLMCASKCNPATGNILFVDFNFPHNRMVACGCSGENLIESYQVS